MAKLFTDLLLEGIKAGLLPAKTQAARNWFREQAQETIVRDQKQVIRSNPIQTSKTITGFMYLYYYKPKNYDTLPYHDTFPLVFPFRRTKEGFYGINMHYLPLEYRAILMDRLYGLSVDDNFDEKTRLKMTYQMLESSSKFRFFRPCIRQYLNSHVRTRLALIPANQWDIALFLPLERFLKSSGGTVQRQKVHLDSVRQIRRGN